MDQCQSIYVFMLKVPISRSCQGCAATDLLDKDERILSFSRGVGR